MRALKNLILRQKMMDRVLISLIPILMIAIFLFGLRILALLAVVLLCGMLAEYAIMYLIQGKKTKISEALFVSCVLYTLTLPAQTPYWVAAVGIIFGIVFAKCAFGGFGRNVFNPALAGRCLVYVSFPAHLTMGWLPPFQRLPGGFARFFPESDAVSVATPLAAAAIENETYSLANLFWGNTGGSLGETSALLIVLAGLYLIVTKTAAWQIIVSSTLSFTGLALILYLTGQIQADPLYALMSGGILFALVFMATDPITAPKQTVSKIIYGLLIGCLSLLLRQYSLFVEGAMFAILIANAFVPLIDRHVRGLKSRQERKKVNA